MDARTQNQEPRTKTNDPRIQNPEPRNMNQQTNTTCNTKKPTTKKPTLHCATILSNQEYKDSMLKEHCISSMTRSARLARSATSATSTTSEPNAASLSHEKTVKPESMHHLNPKLQRGRNLPVTYIYTTNTTNTPNTKLN